MGFEPALEAIGAAPLGIFGAGHLGRAIAKALLHAGWPRERLLLCHSGAAHTAEALKADGLSDRVVAPAQLAADCGIVLYLVRPQAFDAIGGLTMRPDALLVSFLAGIDLARIPAGASVRLRAMTSDPDTLAKRDGIAALTPDHAPVESLLAALRLRVMRLASEEGFVAYTSLGPCLPMAAAWCLHYGRAIDTPALYALGRRYDLSGYPDIVEWGLSVCPKNLARAEIETYLAHAATPGGVTEAVIGALREGRDLCAALECGVARCAELSKL